MERSRDRWWVGSKLRWSRMVATGRERSRGRLLASLQKDCVDLYSGAAGEQLMDLPMSFPLDVDYSPDTRLIALGPWQSSEIRALACGERRNGETIGAASEDQRLP